MSTDDRRQTDGRMQRSQQTRGKIRDAFIDLLKEGDVRPKAAEIADRAGVSLRTLWAAFGDMENLRLRAVQYWMETDEALRSDIDPNLPLAERIDLYCAERERRLLNIAPAATAADLYQMHSEALRNSRRHFQDDLRRDVERVFAQEVTHADDPETFVEALMVCSSWDAWFFLTNNLGLSTERSRQIMIHSVTALTESITRD